MNFILSNFKDRSGALCCEKISAIRLLNESRVFIETGTYFGDTVSAMSTIFDRIYSIELSEELHKNALRRFAGNFKVNLLCGDSSNKIEEAAQIANDQRIIFWLDAHWSGGNTARSTENTPIIKELQSISKLSLKSAIIIIDDIRYFTQIAKGFDVHDANYGYPNLSSFLKEVQNLFPAHKPILNGDLLFIFPEQICSKIVISDALLAANELRFPQKNDNERCFFERIVANCDGVEKETILNLPEVFKHSLIYGIGGDYLYWRALVFEAEKKFDRSKLDIDLARKCGVRISPRAWE